MNHPTAQELAEQILVVPFVEMEPHLKRDAVILVDASLDLAEVGAKVASDDKAAVAGWLGQNLLAKASHLDFEQWRQHKQFFKILIVQPFVLAQNFVNLSPPPAN
ncbi:MAG TPA: DUF2288 family protein [Bdellovibrionota bacterium]|jgi:hypothetical protein|nr:DUF2288 family protein [Bdellovibrionota bacterium]